MDAIEFVKQLRRMDKNVSRKYRVFIDSPEDVVAEVEEWSKDHPRKTRQSVFLEQWPNAVNHNGVPNITPCNIDQSLYDIQRCNGADCSKCRREFWMQEVE